MVVNILGRDITLEKQKEETETKAAREKANIINSLSSMFFATYYIDLRDGTFRVITQKDDVQQVLGEERDYAEGVEIYTSNFVHPDDREEYKKKVSIPNLMSELCPEHPAVAFEYRKAEREEERKKSVDTCQHCYGGV